MKNLPTRTRSQESHTASTQPFFSKRPRREADMPSFFTPAPAIAAPNLQTESAEGELEEQEERLQTAEAGTIRRVGDDLPRPPGEESVGSTLQPKLTVGAPNDPFEREADAVADQVVQRLEAGGAPPLQAKCAACKDEAENNLRRQPEAMLLAKTTGEGEAPPAVRQGIEQTRGAGQPIPSAARAGMEDFFARDFSSVRLHTGDPALAMNRALDARAFTHGRDVYFNEGELDVESREGQHLLAHELSHVVQQGGAIQKRPDSVAPEKEYAWAAARPVLPGNRASSRHETVIHRQHDPDPNSNAQAQPPQAAPPAQVQAPLAAPNNPPTTAPAVTLSDTARFIEPWEGRRSQSYPDTNGHRTVGVGFNLDRAGAAQEIAGVGANYAQVHNGTEALNATQIDTLLQNDANRAIASARNIVSNYDTLPEAAQQIVADMVFNLGATGFSQFQNAINALENNDFNRAADEMQDSNWYNQTGNRAQHHVNAIRNLAAQTPPATPATPPSTPQQGATPAVPAQAAPPPVQPMLKTTRRVNSPGIQRTIIQKEGEQAASPGETKSDDPKTLAINHLKANPGTNKAYAEWILKAKDLEFVTFCYASPQINLDAIIKGEKIGKVDSSKAEIIPALNLIHTLASKRIQKWIDKGGDKPLLNVSSIIRPEGQGLHTSGRAVDITGFDFASEKSANDIIEVLDSLEKGTYEIGLPFQGPFFDLAEKITTEDLQKLVSEKQKSDKEAEVIELDGRLILRFPGYYKVRYDGTDSPCELKNAKQRDYKGPAYNRLKNADLVRKIEQMEKNGFTLTIIPDNNGHIHVGKST